MAVRVGEEKPKSMKVASNMADNYELARKAEGSGARHSLDPSKSTPSAPSRTGSLGQANSKPAVGVQRSKTNFKGISSAGSARSTATWQLPV